MNRSFGVATDGTCVLSPGELEAVDVSVAPLHVRFGSESYTSGPSGDLPHVRFYELLERSTDNPTTSQPSPGEWLALFDAERARGRREILVITIASTMSGTYAGAQVAAASAGGAIAVIDSRTNSGGQGLIVRAVARARQRGCSFEEAVALATRLAGRPVIFAYVDDLAFLRRSGRVAALPAAFGTLLAIKPIVRIAAGRTELVSRARTRRRALERVEQLAREAAGDGSGARIAVIHTNRPALAAEVASRARGWSDDADVFCAEAGPVLATHVGPGVVAIATLEGDQ